MGVGTAKPHPQATGSVVAAQARPVRCHAIPRDTVPYHDKELNTIGTMSCLGPYELCSTKARANFAVLSFKNGFGDLAGAEHTRTDQTSLCCGKP